MQTESSRLIPGLLVKGEISGTADVQVDGEVEGLIRLDGADVTIGAQGRVRGDVAGRNITVEGAVKGGIQAINRIHLRASCRVQGGLAGRCVVIDEGAFFHGSVEMALPAERPAAAEPAHNEFRAVLTASVAHSVREGL